MASETNVLQFGYLLVSTATLLLQAALAVWTVRTQWHERSGRAFVAMLLTGMVWAGCYALFIFFSSPALQELAYRGAMVGSATTIAAFVWFVSVYTGTGFHRRRTVQAALLVSGGGVVVLAVTEPLHGLTFASAVPASEPFPYLRIQWSVLAELLFTVLVCCIYYALAMMAWLLFSTERETAWQLGLFIVGALALTVIELLSRFGFMPIQGMTHAALGLFPFYVLAAVAVLSGELFTVRPVVRNALVEGLSDPVLVVDGDGQVHDYNRQAVRLWPTLAEGTRSFATACPDLAAAVSFPAAGGTQTVQTTVDDGGRDRHYSAQVAELPGGHTSEWYSVTLRDVTELERSRWQLQRQNERLDQVAATISHDLRNPITVAVGYTEVVERELDRADIEPERADRIAGYLTETQQSLDRMEDIIADVLTLAKEGKTVTDTGVVDLEAVARDAWATVDTGDARLDVVDTDTFDADRGRLMRAFENLFRNAVEHGSTDSQDAGEDHSEEVTVTVGATAGGFYVRDDGPGIPPEEHDSVFDYGYTTADDGTGLGLSIVRTVAEAHGWSVRAESRTDGAGFRFMVGSGHAADAD